MYRNRNIDSSRSILEALKKMDDIDKKLLIVIDGNKFKGLLSIGDIQRAIIANLPLSTKISDVIRINFKVGKPEDSEQEIKDKMMEYRMEFYPIVADNETVERVYFWEDVFLNTIINYEQFNLPVVIMAGGKGTRLRPLTNVIPKPMLPIGERTMMEEIFERYAKHGCSNFFLSINYKSNLIKYYLEDLKLPYNIEFFEEMKPMGTAGSLHLLKDKLEGTFFLNNCDILIESDYAEILNFHKENKNDITIIAAMKHINIPYGTIESGENGKLINLKEKPDLNYLINSGMYVIESKVLQKIPDYGEFHLTNLIELIKSQNGKVGVFPVSAKSWKDMGEWNEYLKYIRKIND